MSALDQVIEYAEILARAGVWDEIRARRFPLRPALKLTHEQMTDLKSDARVPVHVERQGGLDSIHRVAVCEDERPIYREVQREDGRWYASQTSGRSRRSAETYATRPDLVAALAFGKHAWTGWAP